MKSINIQNGGNRSSLVGNMESNGSNGTQVFPFKLYL